MKALISPERSASSHLMRLLAFLACLATHASIKAAIIQLTIRPAAPDKVQQRYPDLVVSLCHVLRAPHDSPTHVQAQVLNSSLERGNLQLIIYLLFAKKLVMGLNFLIPIPIPLIYLHYKYLFHNILLHKWQQQKNHHQKKSSFLSNFLYQKSRDSGSRNPLCSIDQFLWL